MNCFKLGCHPLVVVHSQVRKNFIAILVKLLIQGIKHKQQEYISKFYLNLQYFRLELRVFCSKVLVLIKVIQLIINDCVIGEVDFSGMSTARRTCSQLLLSGQTSNQHYKFNVFDSFWQEIVIVRAGVQCFT